MPIPLVDEVVHGILRLLPLEDRGNYRRTCKRNDVQTRRFFKFSKFVHLVDSRKKEIYNTSRLTHGLYPPSYKYFTWSQFNDLKAKFCFSSLNFLTVGFDQVRIEEGNCAPCEIHISELRSLLDELPLLRLVLTMLPRASVHPLHRWAEKIEELPGWATCDRWRLSLADWDGAEGPPHPRFVLETLMVPEAGQEPADGEWASGYYAPPDQRDLNISAGSYPRLRSISFYSRRMISQLAEWLKASEYPNLASVAIHDMRSGGERYEAVIPLADESMWMPQQIHLRWSGTRESGERVIEAIHEKTGIPRS